MTLVFSFTLLPDFTYAEKGDFYKKHESELNKIPMGDDYIETLKAYDSTTNSFECGTFDINCKIHSSQLSWSLGLSNFVADGTQLLVLNPEMITKDEAFVKYKNYLSELSTSMLVLFLVWQVMAMMVRRYGDPDDYPSAMNQKLVAVVVGGIFLGLYEPIFNYILTIQHDVTSAILTSGFDREQISLMVFMYTAEYSVFFTLFVAIIYIVFIIALVYRFVSLGFFYVVGPIAIPTMLNEEFNYFQIWLRYIVNNIITLFLQSLCFALAIAATTNQFSFTKNLPYGVDIAAGFLLAAVFCFFALVVPGILGNLGSSTGTGRTIGRIARYAVMKR